MRLTRSTRRVRTAAISALVSAVTALGPATASAHEDHAPLPAKGVTVTSRGVLLSEKAGQAIGLTTAKITFGDLHKRVGGNARVELPWDQQAMVTSLVAGKIVQVLVRPGESVSAGQELARMASMELESFQLALLEASSDVALARRYVEQRTTLDRQGVIAGKNLLEVQAMLAEKSAALAIAREKLRALGIDEVTLRKIETSGEPLQYVSITSPIDGVVRHADVRPGQTVVSTDFFFHTGANKVTTPTNHLFHIVDPSRVWIVGEVLESDVRHLAKGQPVAARFAAYPDRQFNGVIDHIGLKMDRRKRTQSVHIAVDNRDALLRPGMFGRVSIEVQAAKEAIVCPTDAIIKSQSGKYVLVERSRGKYENRPVRLGLVEAKQVEVLDGLFPGDKVVVLGAYLLASLLGNEHKARTSDAPASAPKAHGFLEDLITVADATVELPTDRQAYATSRIEGRIRRVLVEPTQRVTTGQVLAEVDSLRLREVQLELLESLAQARLAGQSFRRLEVLGDAGVTPKRRIWELRNRIETLRHRVASLKRRLLFFGLTQEEIAALERVDLTSESFDDGLLHGVPVRAPGDGWIVGFHVVPGQMVDTQDTLFEIHDLSKVWVKGYIFERDAARVGIGQPARIGFAAFPDLEAIGQVVRIAPMLEENERVLPVWIEVDNPDRLLKEGMLARVTLLVRTAPAGSTAAETAQLRPVEPRR
ncbi:MAG: efflux RND transporter periplasmic adaptor subunit [Pirellulales bacterium]